MTCSLFKVLFTLIVCGYVLLVFLILEYIYKDNSTLKNITNQKPS